MNARLFDTNHNRILVVEDDHRNMTLLHDLLKAHGYEILKASDGLEAINVARNDRPDLILMDIRLPTISGLDATLNRTIRPTRFRSLP